jgi:hypothetical protein
MNDKQKTAHRAHTARTRKALTRALVYAYCLTAVLAVLGALWPFSAPAVLTSAAALTLPPAAAVVSPAPAAAPAPRKARRRPRKARKVARRAPACCCPAALTAAGR